MVELGAIENLCDCDFRARSDQFIALSRDVWCTSGSKANGL